MAAKKKKPAVADPVADYTDWPIVALFASVAFLGVSVLHHAGVHPVLERPPIRQVASPKPAKIEASIEVAKTDIAKPEPVKVAVPSKPAPPKPTAKVVEVPSPVFHYAAYVKVVTGLGHGSGFHIGNGLFLTATHVVDGVDEVTLKADDGSEHPAEVLWTSPYDVALLRLKEDKSELEFMSSELACRAPVVWEDTTAKGNPMDIEFMETKGHIVGTPRKLGPWPIAMVLDTPLYPGMSGGPLYDAAGKVIGINVGIYRPIARNLAVPSSVACDLLARA